MTNAAAKALQEHPAFAGLSDAVLNAIQKDASLLDFQPGQPLSAGDVIPHQVLLILSGQARLLDRRRRREALPRERADEPGVQAEPLPRRRAGGGPRSPSSLPDPRTRILCPNKSLVNDYSPHTWTPRFAAIAAAKPSGSRDASARTAAGSSAGAHVSSRSSSARSSEGGRPRPAQRTLPR